MLLYYELQSNNYVSVDGYKIGYNKLFDKAAIYRIYWDGDENNTVFTVPDEYKGIKITGFNSNVHRAFFEYLRAPNEYIYFSEINREPVDDYKTLVFTLRIGKNINEIYHKTYTDYINDVEYQYDYILPKRLYLCSYSNINDAGADQNGKTLYEIIMYYDVSEENSTFYSVDGTLYLRETEEKVHKYSYNDIEEIRNMLSE